MDMITNSTACDLSILEMIIMPTKSEKDLVLNQRMTSKLLI